MSFLLLPLLWFSRLVLFSCLFYSVCPMGFAIPVTIKVFVHMILFWLETSQLSLKLKCFKSFSFLVSSVYKYCNCIDRGHNIRFWRFNLLCFAPVYYQYMFKIGLFEKLFIGWITSLVISNSIQANYAIVTWFLFWPKINKSGFFDFKFFNNLLHIRCWFRLTYESGPSIILKLFLLVFIVANVFKWSRGRINACI